LEPELFLELKLVVDDDQDIGGQSVHLVHNESKSWQSFFWRLEFNLRLLQKGDVYVDWGTY
jgi:hypothetical protein